MLEASTPAEVAVHLRASGLKRIAIDGIDGSGKTSLANTLASELGLPVLHLDDFVVKHKDAYIANLDSATLANYVDQLKMGWVLEGVCLLQALEAISLQTDALIYVKRISHGH